MARSSYIYVVEEEYSLGWTLIGTYTVKREMVWALKNYAASPGVMDLRVTRFPDGLDLVDVEGVRLDIAELLSG